jgi:hypothetical protein
MAKFEFTEADVTTENSLLSEMSIDVAINEKSQLWVLHDQPFSYNVDHLEYHREKGDLYFVGDDGTIQHLGMPVPDKTRNRMERAGKAYILHVPHHKKVSAYSTVPVIQVNESLH